MSNVGGGPIQSLYVGIPTNVTIAASMAGTAAATSLSSSLSCSYARSMEVFNLTGRNLELIIAAAADPGTSTFTPGTASIAGAGIIFVPGTATVTAAVGRGIRQPISIQQGMKLFVRTTENTPITCASTTPLIISFWA